MRSYRSSEIHSPVFRLNDVFCVMGSLLFTLPDCTTKVTSREVTIDVLKFFI